jgi:hypothetical protein
MSVETELIKEIEKWSKKLDDSLLDVHTLDDRGTKMLENIHAYRKDSNHFSERGDLVKSFECLIWAWAIIELGKELGHLK